MNIVFPTRLSTYLPSTDLLPLTLVARVVALILTILVFFIVVDFFLTECDF